MLFAHLRDNNNHLIATIEIRNDGTGTEQRGNYDVFVTHGITRSQATTKHARVEFYDRSLGAVELLRQALNAFTEEE